MLQLSHGDQQEQGDRMATVKLVEKLAGKSWFLDTKGPNPYKIVRRLMQKSIHTKLRKIRVATKHKSNNREVIAF